MSFFWVICAVVGAIGGTAIAIALKRGLGISYDRKALSSIWISFFVIVGFYYFGSLGSVPNSDLGTPSKMMGWTIIFVAIVNANAQFFSWLLWSVMGHYNWLKLPRFVFNLVSFILIVGIILYAIKNFHGLPLTGLLVTSTVLSAIIGLALQDTLSNLISGISLQVESPFSIDDWVNLGGFEGKVVAQNWRTLTLQTRDHHRVSLTNKFIAEDKIVNYSRPGRRQIHSFDIVLDYKHPPNVVKKVLYDMICEIEETEPHPTLGAYVMDYKANGIQYGMKFWLEDYAHVYEIQDIVLSRLWYALRRNHIKIPYPISELQVAMHESIDLNKAKSDLEKRVHTFLRSLDWLSQLGDKQIITLSEAARWQRYGNGDILISQGEDGDEMYIILSGTAKVFLSAEGRKNMEVATKAAGEFMGEMSLLTGDPRSATVKAYGDVEALLISKESFVNILMKDEELLNLMIEGMKRYQSGLASIIEEERQRRNTTTESATIIVLQKIKSYLAIGS